MCVYVDMALFKSLYDTIFIDYRIYYLYIKLKIIHIAYERDLARGISLNSEPFNIWNFLDQVCKGEYK